MARTKKRGRPRQFDTDQALAAMASQFSVKGFSGTSLDDLAQAAGLKRPSIYAAFGNKLSIFLAVIDAHFENFEQEMVEAVDPTAPLEEYLNQFYDAELDAFFHGEAARGSFVFSNAVAEAPEYPEIGKRVLRLINALENQLAKKIALDIKSSDNDASKAKPIAQLAIGYLMLLSNKARSGSSKRSLKKETRRISSTLVMLTQ